MNIISFFRDRRIMSNFSSNSKLKPSIMGGEGSMMHANQSLKSNRNMLSKRKKSRFSFVTNSEDKTEYNLPKATKEDIRLLREKLQKEGRQRRRKLFLLICLFVLGFALGLMYLIS